MTATLLRVGSLSPSSPHRHQIDAGGCPTLTLDVVAEITVVISPHRGQSGRHQLINPWLFSTCFLAIRV